MPSGTLSNHRSSHSTLADRARALAVILREEFGVPFLCCDASTGMPVGATGTADLSAAELTPAAVIRLAAEGRVRVTPLPGHCYRLLLVLGEPGKAMLVAIG